VEEKKIARISSKPLKMNLFSFSPESNLSATLRKNKKKDSIVNESLSVSQNFAV